MAVREGLADKGKVPTSATQHNNVATSLKRMFNQPLFKQYA
jgi:hypothetical protein